jgi:hypothetical protein
MNWDQISRLCCPDARPQPSSPVSVLPAGSLGLVAPSPVTSIAALSRDQRRVYRAVVNRGQSCIVVGPGGTGKTRLIQTVTAALRASSKMPHVTSTTGITALPIQGTTIHKFIAFPRDPQATLLDHVQTIVRTCISKCDNVRVARTLFAQWLQMPTERATFALMNALRTTVMHRDPSLCPVHRLQHDARVLIVDEVFMATPRLLTQLALLVHVLRAHRYSTRHPFWSGDGSPLQVIVFGDPRQIPCIAPSSSSSAVPAQHQQASSWWDATFESQLRHASHQEWTMDARCMRPFPVHHLTTMHRHRSDPTMAQLTMRLRKGAPTDRDLALLNQSPRSIPKALALFSTNDQVRAFNEAAISTLPDAPMFRIVVDASTSVQPSFRLLASHMGEAQAARRMAHVDDHDSQPIPASLRLLCTERLGEHLQSCLTEHPDTHLLAHSLSEEPAHITLKANMRLMLTSNVDPAKQLCNGTLVTLRGVYRLDLLKYPPYLAQHPHQATAIELCNHLDQLGVATSVGPLPEPPPTPLHARVNMPCHEGTTEESPWLCPLQPSNDLHANQWLCMLIECEDPLRTLTLPIQVLKVPHPPYGLLQVARFPVKCAHASTVDKAQGLTLSCISIHLDGSMERRPGLTYTAISRVSRLDHLALSRPVTRRDFPVHPSVVAWEAKWPVCTPESDGKRTEGDEEGEEGEEDAWWRQCLAWATDEA